MQESIFTKIINGEIPSHKIYEDEFTFAFLDIHPKTSGHCLVIPKKQVQFVWDLADEDYAALMSTVKKVALRVREVIKPRLVGEQIIGDEVPHAHVHIFPFNNIEEFRRIPDMDAQPNHEALSDMAKKLAF
jgi:histidine triad (HIT) family protein